MSIKLASVLRLFLAVEISPDTRAGAERLIKEFGQTTTSVRWVNPHNLHWTLKFLGDVETTTTPAICDAVQNVVTKIEPFDLLAIGAGAFPDVEHPRTIWIGAGEGADEMAGLYDKLEEALLPQGFRAEQRRFRPHLTLGRVRNARGMHVLAEAISRRADFVAGVTAVDEVTLFASKLTRDGPEYDALAHLDLRG